jgi:hypothetical protein
MLMFCFCFGCRGTAENAYNERVARVEIGRLHNRLGTARNAYEMFGVFSKVNALFVRPKVRGLSLTNLDSLVMERARADCFEYRFVELFKNTTRSLLILPRRISNVYMTR